MDVEYLISKRIAGYEKIGEGQQVALNQELLEYIKELRNRGWVDQEPETFLLEAARTQMLSLRSASLEEVAREINRQVGHLLDDEVGLKSLCNWRTSVDVPTEWVTFRTLYTSQRTKPIMKCLSAVAYPRYHNRLPIFFPEDIKPEHQIDTLKQLRATKPETLLPLNGITEVNAKPLLIAFSKDPSISKG